MPRAKTHFVCQECGFQTSGYLGRCTECNEWNSLVEELIEEDLVPGKNRLSSQVSIASSPSPLTEIQTDQFERFATNISALDLVLGGGVVPGSVILLAGEPGVGKSTLLMQMCAKLAKARNVLYITGEESQAQVKQRATRLNIDSPQILLDADQNVKSIVCKIQESGTKIAIIDSIQAVYHSDITSSAGSVSQVRECASFLAQIAKSAEIAIILVGHVTKDGSIAGPKVLEHLVDVVLQFEGDATNLRMLRAAKNRFGSTQEVGIFGMQENGLVEIDNPSALFLGDRLSKLSQKNAPSGTAVIATAEGTKTMLLEVQALVGSSPYPSPRRVANGFDNSRLLQILAVLERKIGLSLSRFDVYTNIVGGFNFNDPSGDLGMSAAIASSFLDSSLDPKLILIGEIGLTGEVRPVASLTKRLKESASMGFNKAIVPSSNLPLSNKVEGIEVIGVEYLMEALKIIMPGESLTTWKSSLPKQLVNDSRAQARESQDQVIVHG